MPYLDYAGNQDKIESGINHLNDDTLGCVGCHNYKENEFGYVFTLDHYASSEWLTTMISNPNEVYSEDWGTANDRMPAFHSDATKLLTQDEIELLVRFLRQDRTLLGDTPESVEPLQSEAPAEEAETAEVTETTEAPAPAESEEDTDEPPVDTTQEAIEEESAEEAEEATEE